MRFWLKALLLMVGLAAAAPTRAADNPLEKPILQLQVQSVEELLNRAEYIAVLAGKEEEAKQGLGFIRSMIDKNGLEGIDVKKPFVLYAGIAADKTMPFALMVPIASEASVISSLENRLNINPKKGDDGLYTIQTPLGGQEVYVRFANGYAYVTTQDKKNVDAKVLPKPEQIVAANAPLVTLAVNVDNIPKMFRDLALGQMETQMANAKNEEKPNEKPIEKQARLATIDLGMSMVKQFLYETRSFRMAVDIAPKSDDLGMAFELEPLPGTDMAKLSKSMLSKQTVAGGAVDLNSPIALNLNFAIPESLNAIWLKAVDTLIADGLAKAKPEERADAEKLLRSFEPTLKSGILDLAVAVQPSGDKWTIQAGLRTASGKGIESAVKAVSTKLPAEMQAIVKLDADKAGDLNLHELKIGSTLDPNGKRVLGESNLWFALRDDLLLVAIGPDAQATVKKSVGKPAISASPMKLNLGVKALTPTFDTDKERATAAKFAKEVFDKKPGSDNIVVAFEGGETLKLKVGMKGTLIQFFQKMDAAKKGD